MTSKDEWAAVAAELLVGKTIIAAEYRDDNEFGNILTLVLNDGTEIQPFSDCELNGIGAIVLAGSADAILPGNIRRFHDGDD